MSFRRLLLASSLLAAVPFAALAQAQPGVGELVVTTSRFGAAASNDPYLVQVLPGPALAARTSVADALAGLAEVQIQAPGGRSGFASLFLRGADPNFTVVLLDGVPLNNPTNSRGGAVNVSELDAAALDRIEVVSGPLSSLYGSGSLAGAINLIVPGGADHHSLKATVGAGTRSDYSASLLWRGPLAADAGGSLSLATSDDGTTSPGGGRFRNWSLTGKLDRPAHADAGRVIFRVSETDARAFPDSSGGPRLAVRRGRDRRDGREALVGVDQPVVTGPAVRLDLSGSFLHRRDITASGGVAPSAFDRIGVPAGKDDSRYDRAIGAAIARFGALGWRGAAGVEVQRETGASDGTLVFFGAALPTDFHQARTTYSAFVEADRSTERMSFNTGARLDRVGGEAARVTARAAMRYRLGPEGLSVRATLGTGFKAPSFYALGNPFVGNPNLAPETSRTAEAGLVWSSPRGDSFSLTAFHSRFTNLIDFVPGPPPRLENRALVVSKGVSAEVKHRLTPRLAGGVQLQYADTREGGGGPQLLNRPRWRATADVRWTPSDTVSVTARYGYAGERQDYAIPTGQRTLGAYSQISLDAAWAVRAKTTVRLAVDNLLDDRHEDAIGFTSPGFVTRLLVSQTF